VSAAVAAAGGFSHGPRRSFRSGLASAGIARILHVSGPAAWAGDVRPSGDSAELGAYCPLPKPGQAPAACLGTAQSTYADFFSAVESGTLDELDQGSAARGEADLYDADRAYLALSSLAYGYYRVAESAARAPGADDAFAARLAHWNELLGKAYQDSAPAQQGGLRGALQQAVADLRAHAPAVALHDCVGSGSCTSTGALVEAFGAIDRAAGLRSPLAQLVQRLLGTSADAE